MEPTETDTGATVNTKVHFVGHVDYRDEYMPGAPFDFATHAQKWRNQQLNLAGHPEELRKADQTNIETVKDALDRGCTVYYLDED
jgi:hypothetical protein